MSNKLGLIFILLVTVILEPFGEIQFLVECSLLVTLFVIEFFQVNFKDFTGPVGE